MQGAVADSLQAIGPLQLPADESHSQDAEMAPPVSEPSPMVPQIPGATALRAFSESLHQLYAEAFRIFVDRNLEQHPRRAVRFELLANDRISAGCDDEYRYGVLRLDPDTLEVLFHHRDPESETLLISPLDSFAEQSAATLLRTRRLNRDALEQAFAGAAARIRRTCWLVQWEGRVRDGDVVAIWNNEVRLPLDVYLCNGRLVAHPEDGSDRDLDEWDLIEDVVSEFARTAATRRH